MATLIVFWKKHFVVWTDWGRKCRLACFLNLVEVAQCSDNLVRMINSLESLNVQPMKYLALNSCHGTTSNWRERQQRLQLLRKATTPLVFFNEFIYYLFLAVLGLRCCTWAFSSCSERGLLFVVLHGLLIAVASLAVEHGHAGFSSCGRPTQ